MSLDQNIAIKNKFNKNIIFYISIFIIGAVAYYLSIINEDPTVCLLYTSDAADDP